MAQKNRTDLQSGIDAAINDNTTGEISAADVRSTMKDVADSGFNLITDDSDDITEGVSHLFMTSAEKNKIAEIDGKVDENAPITGATKTKITYDAKGLVTAGADATTADIADSSNKRYVTDAQLTVIGNTSGVNTGDQDLSAYATTSYVNSGLAGKQETLISGTNIKTINGASVLGSGDLVVSGGADTALSNLASVAINTSLVLGTSDGGALGSTTKMWSDLFLASGAVINWNNGDVTLTHSGNLLTLAGGNLDIGLNGISGQYSTQKFALEGRWLKFTLDTSPTDNSVSSLDVNGLTVASHNSGTSELTSQSLIIDNDSELKTTITDSSVKVENYDTLDYVEITNTNVNIDNQTILSDDYLNFSSTVGTSGFGFRNLAGVMEYKNSGGYWSAIETYSNRLILASDVTSTGTSYVDVTGMSFGYEANATYVFDMYLLVTSAAATTGHGFSWNTSTTVTDVALTFYHQLATATGTLSGGSGIGDDNVTQAGITSGVPGTGLQYIQGSGILRSNANTGSAQFRKRSEVAGNSTIKAGSVIIVRRIA